MVFSTDFQSFTTSPVLSPETSLDGMERTEAQHSDAELADYSGDTVSDESSTEHTSGSPPAMTSTYDFPAKLYKMLSDSEADGNAHIFSWMPHGKSFRIHKRKEFISEVLPKYYYRVNVRSFLRQLNLYGFKRQTKKASEEYNSYRHKCMVRGQPKLVAGITRIARTNNKSGGAGGTAADTMMIHAQMIKQKQHHFDTTITTTSSQIRDSNGTTFHFGQMKFPEAPTSGLVRYVSSNDNEEIVKGEDEANEYSWHSMDYRSTNNCHQHGSVEAQRVSPLSYLSSGVSSSTLIKCYRRHHHREQQQPHQQQIFDSQATDESQEMNRFRDILTLFLSPEDAMTIRQKGVNGVLAADVKEKIKHILNDLEPTPCL